MCIHASVDIYAISVCPKLVRYKKYWGCPLLVMGKKVDEAEGATLSESYTFNNLLLVAGEDCRSEMGIAMATISTA